MLLVRLLTLTLVFITLALFGATAVGQNGYPPARFYQYEHGYEIEHTVSVFRGRVHTVRRPRTPRPLVRTTAYTAPDGPRSLVRECVDTEERISRCTLFLQEGSDRTTIAEDVASGHPFVVWVPDGEQIYVLVNQRGEEGQGLVTLLHRYHFADETLTLHFDKDMRDFRCDDSGMWCHSWHPTLPSGYKLHLFNVATGQVAPVTDQLGRPWRTRWQDGAPMLIYSTYTDGTETLVRYNAPTSHTDVIFTAPSAYAIANFRLANDDDRWLALWAGHSDPAKTTLHLLDLQAAPTQSRIVYIGPGLTDLLWWTPNGAHAVFIGGEERRYNLYSVAPHGDLVPLTDFDNASRMHVEFSDDGEWLLAMVGFYKRGIYHTDATLYRIRVDGSEPPVVVPLPFEWDFNDWQAWFTW